MGNLTIRLDPKIHAQLKRAAIDRNSTMTALIEGAVRARFDPEAHQESERVLLRTLRGLRIRMERVELSMRANAEATAMVARTVIAALPAPNDEDRKRAELVFQRFSDALTAKMNAKSGLIDALLDAFMPTDLADEAPTYPHHDPHLPK